MLTKKLLFFILVFISVVACRQDSFERQVVDIYGEKLDLDSDLSCYQISYACDSLIVVASFSPTEKLTSYYRIGNTFDKFDFLHIGNGPLEVLDARIKYHSDTLFVISSNPSGVSSFISIPINGIKTHDKWNSIPAPKNCLMGADFAVTNDGDYLILMDDFNKSNIVTRFDSSSSDYLPMGYWPDDEYDGEPLLKQIMYMRSSTLFAQGDKCLFVSGEGHFASVIDFSSNPYSEIFLYNDYPLYEVSSDGNNPKRMPNTALGMYSFATDSRIFLSPLTCKLKNGSYVPDNYKGYPAYYVDEINVFDWDGKYKHTYRTDIPFTDFFYNQSENKLYILSQDNEELTSEIYVYDL